MMTVKATYAAEDRIAKVLARGGTVDFHGSTLDLGRVKLRQFHPTMLPLAQGAVDGLYKAAGGVGAAPTVVLSKSLHRAAYVPWKHQIELPPAPWAWQSELVLLHELAHSMAPAAGNQREAHGAPWRRRYCALVLRAVGPEASLLMMEALELDGPA